MEGVRRIKDLGFRTVLAFGFCELELDRMRKEGFKSRAIGVETDWGRKDSLVCSLSLRLWVRPANVKGLNLRVEMYGFWDSLHRILK